MAKSKKVRKAEVQAQREARRITPGKFLRLFLKSMVFAIVLALVLTVLEVSGITLLQNRWVTFGIMGIMYLLFWPFLMRDFRPERGDGLGKR